MLAMVVIFQSSLGSWQATGRQRPPHPPHMHKYSIFSFTDANNTRYSIIAISINQCLIEFVIIRRMEGGCAMNEHLHLYTANASQKLKEAESERMRSTTEPIEYVFISNWKCIYIYMCGCVATLRQHCLHTISMVQCCITIVCIRPVRWCARFDALVVTTITQDTSIRVVIGERSANKQRL